MKLANCKTNAGCVVALIAGGLLIGGASFWAGRASTGDQPPAPAGGSGTNPTSATGASNRLITAHYWRLADWEQLGPGRITNPNPGDCGPDQFSHIQHSGPGSEYDCLDRPQDPSQADEEVVDSLRAEALDRFNVDTKPRGMRVISSYVQTIVDFPYRATTPDTCRSNSTNRVESTLRDGLDLSGAWAVSRATRAGNYSYVISEGCGDWVLDAQALAESYGGAFFYQEPRERFNSDTTDFGVRPVDEINYPSRFSYRPTTPDTCRYYLADSSFSRAGVDRLFEESAVDGQRRNNYFVQNTDYGGWYDYDGSSVEITTSYGYTFIISEGCGDWMRTGVEDLPANNQIFDHPYETGPFTH